MRTLRAAAAVTVLVCGWGARGAEGAGGGGGGDGRAVYERYAVAADHPLASRAGAEILAAGGNAVDAAVATSLALSVVRPFSCGIGGGGFMVIWSGGGTGAARDGDAATEPRPPFAVAINYREMTPGAVGPEYFQKLDDPDASTRGGTACAVPGTVAGLLHALEKYGSLDRARVLAPAIRLAKDGYTADEAYAAAARGLVRKFEDRPEWKDRFAFTWERFLGSGRIKAGDLIRLPEQAAVLERIAAHGREGFYAGPTAEALIAEIRAAGGEMTLEDLAAFRVVEGEPLRSAFAGRTLLTMPPPSSGGLAMAQVFGLLERKDLAGAAARGEWGAYTHLLTESFKHAFADRATWLADPAFVEVPVARLMSPAYLDRLAGEIRIARTMGPEVYGSRPGDANDPDAPPGDGGTSHLSVIDLRPGRRMAVACTETINLHFGSLVSSDQLGFCVNNQMDDFTTRWAADGEAAANAFKLVQSERNRPRPGKRPLSSMSPTIVLDAEGRVEAVAGGSGGPRIITATTQVLLNALVRGEDAGRAVSRARIHHQWKPNTLELEPGFDERQGGLAVEQWMRKLGHQVAQAKPAETACVQLIVVKEGKLEAASDPRKGGSPAGK